MDIFDEYSMRQASIFDLRNMARDMGVNSPTVFKKEELIEKMLKIINGEEKPQMPKSRQGRPPKKALAITNNTGPNMNYENMILFRKNLRAENSDGLSSKRPTEYNFNSHSYGGNWFLASPTFVYGETTEKPKNIFNIEKHKGYFFTAENNTLCIFKVGRTEDVNNIIFVPENLVNAFELKPGDYLEYNSRSLTANSLKYLSTIQFKNGSENIKLERGDFDSYPMISSSEKQNCFKDLNNLKQLENTILGTRNIIFTPSLTYYSELLKSIDDKKEDYVVINLCLDALPEDIEIFLKAKNFENFYTILGDSEKQNIITVNLAVERAKRLAELNINTVFLVNDVKKVIKYQNLCIGNGIYEIKGKSLFVPYKLITVARKISIGPTVTLYAMYKTDKDEKIKNFDFIVKKEIENMGTYIFNIAEEENAETKRDK